MPYTSFNTQQPPRGHDGETKRSGKQKFKARTAAYCSRKMAQPPFANRGSERPAAYSIAGTRIVVQLAVGRHPRESLPGPVCRYGRAGVRGSVQGCRFGHDDREFSKDRRYSAKQRRPARGHRCPDRLRQCIVIFESSGEQALRYCIPGPALFR